MNLGSAGMVWITDCQYAQHSKGYFNIYFEISADKDAIINAHNLEMWAVCCNFGV